VSDALLNNPFPPPEHGNRRTSVRLLSTSLLKEKFENKKLNTSNSKHNIPTYIYTHIYIYLFIIEIQTVSPILVKFGIRIYFDGRKVLSDVVTLYPNPQGQGALNWVWGASTAKTMQLGENFIKQKL
jgi:hypothetical protein